MAEETKAPSAGSSHGDSRPERSGPPRGPRPGGGPAVHAKAGGRKFFRRKKVASSASRRSKRSTTKMCVCWRSSWRKAARSRATPDRRVQPHQRRLSRAISRRGISHCCRSLDARSKEEASSSQLLAPSKKGGSLGWLEANS